MINKDSPGVISLICSMYPLGSDVNTPTTGNLEKRSPLSVVCAGGHCLQTAAHPLNPQGIKPGLQEAQGDNRTKALLLDAKFSIWSHIGITQGALKMHRPRLHPRPITSASLEVDQATVFFKSPGDSNVVQWL